jgi:hypothetical protein
MDKAAAVSWDVLSASSAAALSNCQYLWMSFELGVWWGYLGSSVCQG